jgi:hypothetical protein
MDRRGLRFIALAVFTLAAAVASVPATSAYFQISVALPPIQLTVAMPTPSPTPTPTPSPTPTPTPALCDASLFSYDQYGPEPYPMIVVNVWANRKLPKGCSRSFSLNSYTTQGPTWPYTGTQALFDHQSITLDADHTRGTLAVKKPVCFGQTDFYLGATRFDGVDGPLPNYPGSVVPQPMLAWSNGSSACPDRISAPTPTPTPTPSPSPSPTPAPTAEPTPAPSPMAELSPSPSPTPAPTPTPAP